MGAAGGRGRIVVPADELGYRPCEIARELGASGRRSESDLRVDRQRSQILARSTRTSPEISDFLHDARSERDQVARGEPIPAGGGIRGRGPQGLGGDDERL